ncbi:hypothetical protein GIB67_017884 [Kingdonia uniflora]|uniref:RHOMBOID-like protein n=1 Tax=Kingdonia uniflora TaxID=39325 RepID=A0A7J7MKU7_9MAGN|nr:hypothetical protein GIB67_017884 [Kingdonia uniflora]
MAKPIKDHLELEIKPSENDYEESPTTKTVFFFGCSRSHSRRTEKNTWVISLFVMLHLVAFAATMFVNDCPTNSNQDCVLGGLGRLSFQPLAENPFLGPSSSTLDTVGALCRKSVIKQHQVWRLFTCPWLHAGFIHLVVNLASVIFVGIHLEQEFGPLRIGVIYMLSALFGSLGSAFFVQNIPAVGSSGALFGLLGALLSGLIRNWKVYSDKFAVLAALVLVALVNFGLGLLPHVDNFSNMGGFVSGFLLGLALLFNPHVEQVAQNKKGLFEYNEKISLSFKHKLDKPVLRSVSLVLFTIIVAGGVIGVIHGFNANKYCSWCHYANCVPSKRWSCNEKIIPCEVTVSAGRLTLTCKRNDKFQTFPFTNISQARIADLCSQICS